MKSSSAGAILLAKVDSPTKTLASPAKKMLDELFEIAHGGDSSSSEGPSPVLPAPSKDKELQDPPLSPSTDMNNDVFISLKVNKDITIDSTEHNTETTPSTKLASTDIILPIDSVASKEAAPSIDPSATEATLSADLAVANEVAPSTILTHTETHMSRKIEGGVILNQKKQGLLRDQVQLVKRKDCDRYEIVPIQDPLSIEKGFFIVIRACQLLGQKNDGITLVGLAGPSGAGKTIFTEKILNFMPSIAVISMDNYNDSSRIVDGNFADPRLTDYDTLLKNVHDLKAGKQVQVPIYDFKSSSRTGYRTLEVPSSRIVIIEGIYALSEKLQPLLDLRVSITGGVHFDLVKQVLRDVQHSGQEPEEIINQISGTVYPMYKAFIEPDLQTAHVKIINKFNPFTGFQGPTYILKSARNVTLDQIKAVLSKGHKETMEQTNDIYLLPPGEDPHSCQSYLRMRNNDGKYSLMFEHWVTDSPFLISPRITFEVSVRLLGGLMALGYTIATILKRSSHVFSDERVCVKIDWLEQLNRRYIQVQGRDRLVVKYVAEQLGLEGSYTPRTYIEQFNWDKDVNESMALPDDLKTKRSTKEDLASSPKEALSRDSTDRAAMRNKHLKRWLSHSNATQRDEILSNPTGFPTNSQRFDDRNSESPVTLANQHIIDINSDVVNHETHQKEDAWSQKVNLEWIFVITNFFLELPSAVFDQLSSVHKPLYALISMFMSFMAMLVSIIELIYKGRKERVTWRWTGIIPWFYHPSPSNKRFGTFTDIVGLACAIPQFIAATITYSLACRNADNPIKISVWPIIFAFGLLCSKVSENPNKRTSSLKRDS